MGIFINMKIADTITQEEWSPVYEKSLLMAQKFGFFDFGKKEIHGEKIMCIFPTEVLCRLFGSCFFCKLYCFQLLFFIILPSCSHYRHSPSSFITAIPVEMERKGADTNL